MKLLYIPLYSLSNETVQFVRDGYVYALCFVPELDIADANDVSMVRFEEGKGFVGGISNAPETPNWLIFSDTIYSSFFKTADTALFPKNDAMYFNKQVDSTLVWIYNSTFAFNYRENIPGNSALLMSVDLQYDQRLSRKEPFSPMPIVEGEHKFSTALCLCDVTNESVCKFEATP